MDIRNIAVIGAGPLGLRLAVLFAGAGFATVLEDVLPSNLRKAAEYLEAARGQPSDRKTIAATISFASRVEDAVRAADLVVDCVPDELESKLEIFSMLDRMAPPTAIFVTPTRSLSIADLASCTYRADRCLAATFATSSPLDEKSLTLISTSQTDPGVLEAVATFWARVGFKVELKIDPAEASVLAGTLF